MWDRATGTPVGPGLGWQDLRTIGACLALRAEGVRVGPNQSATKVQWLLDQLDDRARASELCFGTVDTWIAWTLSGGALHVTDATNAAITGLQNRDASALGRSGARDSSACRLEMMPAIVDSAGRRRRCDARSPARRRSPRSWATSRRRSSARAACAAATPRSRSAPAACSTSCSTRRRRGVAQRNEHGTFPIVAWRHGGRSVWGVEAVMLAAGTNVQWLRDDLGHHRELRRVARRSPRRAPTAAASCSCPRRSGSGTPDWDYGARGALFGLTRGTGRAEIARAVLEGIAHRGADLVDAAEADSGITIPRVRVDGGMTDNPTFVQALADATQRPVEISPVREATGLGAALLAGIAVGHHASVDELATTWKPRETVEPARVLDRDRWRDAVERSRRWIPELSGIDF